MCQKVSAWGVEILRDHNFHSIPKKKKKTPSFINVALKCGNLLFKQREVRIHLAPSILLDSLIHIDVLDDPSKNSFLDSLKKQFSNNLYLSKQITTTNKHYPSHQGFISKYIKVARPNSREGGFKVLFDILLGNSLIVTDGESWWSQF